LSYATIPKNGYGKRLHGGEDFLSVLDSMRLSALEKEVQKALHDSVEQGGHAC
jgi:hypothetical protein